MARTDITEQPSRTAKNFVVWITFGVLVTGWVAITLFGDFLFIRPTIQQLPTYFYESTSGQITHSEVVVHHDVEDVKFLIKVAYNYDVNGKMLTGSRYRLGRLGTSELKAKQYVREHPPFTPVTVFFDPSIPSDAVLVRGIEGDDLLILLVLVVFNVPIIMGCYIVLIAVKNWREHKSRALESDFSIVDSDGRNCFRMPDTQSPIMKGLIECFWTSFVLTFFAMITLFIYPLMTVALGLWLLLFWNSMRAGVRQRRAINAKHFDLVFDPVKRTVRLPLVRGRKELLEWSVEMVRFVELRECLRVDGYGEMRTLEVRICSAKGDDEVLIDTRDLTSKEPGLVVQFLREHLNLEMLKTVEEKGSCIPQYRILPQS